VAAKRGALSPRGAQAIASLGFERATPVQAATIPLFLSHKDVCVQAVTGSGKTLSFAIPVFEMLAARREALKPHDVGALILAPTRELAQQIHGVLARIGAFYPRLSLALLVSGQEAARSDAALLRGGCNIAVGTPGRVEATLKRVREFNVRTLEVLVLDEADRLLDAGFAASVTFILQRLPKQRRTGLFSATQTREVEELARAGMRNPVRVDVAVQYKRRAAPEPPAAAAAAAAAAPSRKRGAAASTEGGGDTQATPATLRNFYVVLPPAAKLGALAAFLAAHAQRKVIVFFLTCAQVEYFARLLPQLGALAGLRFSALHGQMEARRRERAYQAFLEQPSGVLLATDVAARGIDVPDVHWIVQFDAPLDPSFFVHRIGRTARMGKEVRVRRARRSKKASPLMLARSRALRVQPSSCWRPRRSTT
jgi:ATP-dependent RNA helicase DDX55/SPB4